MTQPLLLNIVQRLEGLLGRLPDAIQKPVLHELTPLKELFLAQRAPRFVLTGAHGVTVPQLADALFARTSESSGKGSLLMELYRWHDLPIGELGKISVLDARGLDDATRARLQDELTREPADLFVHFAEESAASATALSDLSALVGYNDRLNTSAKVIGAHLVKPQRADGGSNLAISSRQRLIEKLQSAPAVGARLAHVFDLAVARNSEAVEIAPNERQALIVRLAEVLPNPARVEMVRISGDRAAQRQIAQLLVKSASAICAAVGAQPIPLADLPVLAAIQGGMVTGIMHISGRERNVRAATEFLGALGANLGAGMLLREGARAALKFFPGWGNVVCGMVAGAGTYAIGRAATGYFVDGISLSEAKRAYLATRKKRQREIEQHPPEKSTAQPVE